MAQGLDLKPAFREIGEYMLYQTDARFDLEEDQEGLA